MISPDFNQCLLSNQGNALSLSYRNKDKTKIDVNIHYKFFYTAAQKYKLVNEQRSGLEDKIKGHGNKKNTIQPNV